MSLLISTQSIGKSFGAHSLFSDISLGLFSDERMGLIGPNGSGKSTMMKILAEEETPDSGTLSKKRDTHLCYLPQDDVMEAEQSIEETLLSSLSEDIEDAERYQRVREILHQMKFSDPDQKVGNLSGGWRKRVAIARALIQKPDLLLMDEPTNHLDLEGILWLEDLLKRAPFAFVLVSHDRYFLENTTNRIVELNKRYPEGFLKVEGNYSAFLQQREDFINEQAQREQVLSNKVRRELEWLRRGPKARSTKARSRIDGAHQLQSELSDVKQRNAQNQKAQIDFDATQRKTKKLLEGKSLGLTRGGKKLFENLSLSLSPKSCLGLMGLNGSGKSSLVKLMGRELKPDTGEIQWPDDLKIVTFDQDREQLNPNQTLKQALSPSGDNVIYQGTPMHVVSWAKRFLFPSDQLGMPVAQLSGGEQARVLIANLMLRPADILMLDEPTNDLDIPTLEVLEDNLSEFPGALVLITHDRYLLDRLSDQILYLDGNGSAEFFADYDQWLAHRKNPPAPESGESPTSDKASRKLSHEERKELNRIEKKIQKAEEKVESIQGLLQDPEIMSDSKRLGEIYEEQQAAENEVEKLYERWEELEALSQA